MTVICHPTFHVKQIFFNIFVVILLQMSGIFVYYKCSKDTHKQTLETMKDLLLDTLEGQEIRTTRYETCLGIVSVKKGQIIADGKVIVANPSKKELHDLNADLFYNEFGCTVQEYKKQLEL